MTRTAGGPGRLDPQLAPHDRPLLLLDIDGVLNAFPKRPDGYNQHWIDGYFIHFHRELPQMVAELVEHFDVVWFTMWNGKASPMVGPHVGLERIGHFHTSWEIGDSVLAEQGYPRDDWDRYMAAKTPLLPGLLDPQQRWVWIDDAHSSWDHGYLTERGFDPAGFRLIRTDETVGLTWNEVGMAVEQAIAWEQGRTVVLPETAATVDRDLDRRVVPGAIAGRRDAVDD